MKSLSWIKFTINTRRSVCISKILSVLPHTQCLWQVSTPNLICVLHTGKEEELLFAKASSCDRSTLYGHQNDRWYERTGGERLPAALRPHERVNCCSLERGTCDWRAQRARSQCFVLVCYSVMTLTVPLALRRCRFGGRQDALDQLISKGVTALWFIPSVFSFLDWLVPPSSCRPWLGMQQPGSKEIPASPVLHHVEEAAALLLSCPVTSELHSLEEC